MYSLSNEPCLKYSKEIIADKGVEKHSFTSYRLTQEVIYLENESQRFELSMAEQTSSTEEVRYNFVQVLHPSKLDHDAMKQLTIPLPPSHMTPLHTQIKWTDISWGNYSIRISNEKEYFISKVLFMKRSTPIPVKE